MQVQSYKQEVEVSESSSTELEVTRDHQDLLNELRMTTVLNDVQSHYGSRRVEQRLTSAELFYPEWSEKERKMWKTFLPTATTMRTYDFDVPPVEVLEQIKFAKDLELFDDIMFWDPRGSGIKGHAARRLDIARDKFDSIGDWIDPVAVGVITDSRGRNHLFPIVRWGESLKPIEEIRSEVRKTNFGLNMLFFVLPAIILVMMVAGFVVATMAVGLWIFAYAAVGVLIGAILLSALMILLDW